MAEREDRMRDRQYQRAREGFTVSQGTPMALWCPQCSRPHVDEGEWAHRAHRTHLCATCGHEWTPYDYTTVGVPHGQLPGFAPIPTVDTLEAFARQMTAITNSACEMVRGKRVRIVVEHRDQQYGTSKPDLCGREFVALGVYHDAPNGVCLWLQGLDYAVPVKKVEFLEKHAGEGFEETGA